MHTPSASLRRALTWEEWLPSLRMCALVFVAYTRWVLRAPSATDGKEGLRIDP